MQMKDALDECWMKTIFNISSSSLWQSKMSSIKVQHTSMQLGICCKAFYFFEEQFLLLHKNVFIVLCSLLQGHVGKNIQAHLQ